jgi:hypothetical protein
MSGSRDFLTEMHDFISLRATGTYTVPVLAQEIVEELLQRDPKLLRGWLEAHAVSMVRDLINSRDKSLRAANRTIARRDSATRSVFRDAIEAAEKGDHVAAGELNKELEQRQTDFLSERYLTEDGSKVALRDMTRTQLTFAADSYHEQARGSLLQEAFLRAIARRLNTRTVSEVFDEEKLAKIWRSLPGTRD